MKVVLQRSKEASVTVDGEVKGRIQSGLVLLVGITHGDTEAEAAYIADKVVNLRIFEDDDGKMNHSLLDGGGRFSPYHSSPSMGTLVRAGDPTSWMLLSLKRQKRYMIVSMHS